MDTSSPKPEGAPATGNVPEFSVAEISGAVRRTLEGAFGRVRVRGEITECKRYPSGHIYLSLKDENAKLESVIWKTAVPRLSVQPENGVEVIATGRITTYADRSKYQMVIDRLEYAGEGALLARIEKLRAKLTAEGLFETSRKRPLPALPQVVGVVTSEAGAVIQDIRTTIARRFPRRIILWPVPVQGAGAAEKIAAAIEGFGRLTPGGAVPRPDVLIVARGGGSLEDLMAFNEEVVVRAAAACPIPLISAVGHETDTTLIDFAADRRAPTPTAAAELAVPARAELLAALDQTGARLRGAATRQLRAAETLLLRLERRLPDIPARVTDYRRRLDEAGDALPSALRGFVRLKREAIGPLAVPHPRAAIAARRHALAMLDSRQTAALARRIQRGRGQQIGRAHV
jgi:exodeoxyribonuclease VII large subunit